jgi:hypothetical protein
MTPRNGQQHFDMPPTDPLAVSLDEGSSSSADKIGTSFPIVTYTCIKTAWQSLLHSLMRSVCRRAATTSGLMARRHDDQANFWIARFSLLTRVSLLIC